LPSDGHLAPDGGGRNIIALPANRSRGVDPAHPSGQQRPWPGLRFLAVIMTVLCLVIAARLIGDGISGLT
jgi:hypothetical protein